LTTTEVERMARQRTRTQTTTETQGFVHDDENVSFRDGTMHVGGQPMWPAKVSRWESSNGTTVYTAIIWYNQGTGEWRTSCNCPGWAIKKRGKHRQCTHTKDLEGIQVCPRKKVGANEIRSVQEAVELVPDMEFGKCLRSIELD
jgi:hypothetical protein